MWCRAALLVLGVSQLALLVLSVSEVATTQWLFINTTYYLLMATVLCWAGVYLQRAEPLRREQVLAWVRENWRGLLIALIVTLTAGLAIEPALRVLSDEANLVGTSKNLFASKTATFTVSGKYYYDTYWDVDVALDRRPALFPFLVSLVHAVCGYSYKNVFAFNLLLLPAFVLVAYRFAKSLAGETFGIVSSFFVVLHPITLISVRSGGFDFFANFFALLVIHSLHDYCREQTPAKLATLWMNLCVFAEIRYESALFVPLMLVLLLALRLFQRSTLEPYAFIHVLTPAFLLPRIWQSTLLGNVPEQEPGAVALSAENFVANATEYLKPLLSPGQAYPSHSAVVIALGLFGSALWLRWLLVRLRARDWKSPRVRFALGVGAWMALQTTICFAYVWGRAQYPSAARLVMALDTFLSFAAAWVLTRSLERWKPFIAVLLAAALFVAAVPIASQHRLLNRLTQTRENATTWKFFERLNEKRILIVTDRPNLFTIMNYGAMSFDAARSDPYLFTAFARHLFHDVYVIQQVRLSTNEIVPGYEIWPTRKLDTVLEFQNDADVLVRISRLARAENQN
jgi:hypothetical protein